MALLIIIFVIGISVGFIARQFKFCIFGAIVELITLGTPLRIFGVISAMLIFAFFQHGQYQHSLEYPGLIFLFGGLLQGVGYYLAMGCPLSILVRIGEGNKFHFIVFISFIAGLALYINFAEGYISNTIGNYKFFNAITVMDLFK